MSAAYADGLSRGFLVAGLFALIGPPVGLITLIAGEMLRNWPTLGGLTSAALWHMISSTALALPFAYFLGAIPAAAAGILIAVCKETIGRTPWWIALAIGIVVGSAFVWFMERRPPSSTAPPATTPLGSRLVFLSVNVVPTMLCWWIVRNWFVQRTQQ